MLPHYKNGGNVSEMGSISRKCYVKCGNTRVKYKTFPVFFILFILYQCKFLAFIIFYQLSSQRHVISCHPIFKTCHTVITYLMLSSTKIMLLSHTSTYYQQKSFYYQTHHAIIHKTYVIIIQLVILSDTSTTHDIITLHFIVRQLMLLSNN